MCLSRKQVIVTALAALLVSFIAYHFYPQLWLVPRWRYEFSKRPGLYVVPREYRDAHVQNCKAYGLDGNTTSLRVENISIQIPARNQKSFKDYGNHLYRVSYKDGKVIAIMGQMPTADDAEIPLKGSDLKDAWSAMLHRRGIGSNRQLILEILNTTPADLSVSQNLVEFFYTVSLINMKVTMVPPHTRAGYQFTVNKNLHGAQMGDPSLGDEVIFVQLFDQHDQRYQIIFYGFDAGQVSCFLGLIQENLREGEVSRP